MAGEPTANPIGGLCYYTAGTGYGNVIWANWCQSLYGQVTTGAQTVASNVVWAVWNDQYVSTQTASVVYQQVAVAAPAPPAVDHHAAEKKAEELLFLFLSEEQKKQYKEHGYFETEVNDNRYRIARGRAGNIYRLDKSGKPVTRLCVHPEELLPSSDNVLAQYLALHSDEQQLLRTANHTKLA